MKPRILVVEDERAIQLADRSAITLAMTRLTSSASKYVALFFHAASFSRSASWEK